MVKRKNIYTLAGIILLFAGWQILSLVIGNFIVPPPASTIIQTAYKLTLSFTWKQIGSTIFRVLTGFSLAFIGGIITGIIIGSSKKLEYVFRPAIVLFQGIPPILWAIPLILIFGTGNLSPILVISLICFPLITLNIAEGIKTESKELKEMLYIYAPEKKARLRELTLPHLKPFILSSLKIGMVLGIKASVVAEFFGANNGIGFQIEAAYQAFEVKNLFSWGIILIILIIVFDQILSRLNQITKLIEIQRVKIQNKRCGIYSSETFKTTLYTKTSTSQVKEKIVQINALSFSYPSSNPNDKTPDRCQILKNINLTVKDNEIAVITGDSGIGKTTLLKVIMGIIQPDSGEISIPQNIGVIFQDDRLLPWKTIINNVALPLIYERRIPINRAICFSGFLLRDVGLDNHLFKYPSQLSGGMKKRAALARCFAKNPDVILMDEPFSGLHREARIELWEKLFLLLKYRQIPVIIATHFPEEIPDQTLCSFYKLKGNPATIEKLL